MTFLSKLGSAVVKGIAIITGVYPLVSGVFGSSQKVQSGVQTAVNDLNSIGQVVVTAEAMLGPGTGAQKLAASAPLVANILKTSELVAGKKIADENLFLSGAQKITSGMADILNSLHPDAATTAGQPLATT